MLVGILGSIMQKRGLGARVQDKLLLLWELALANHVTLLLGLMH